MEDITVDLNILDRLGHYSHQPAPHEATVAGLSFGCEEATGCFLDFIWTKWQEGQGILVGHSSDSELSSSHQDASYQILIHLKTLGYLPFSIIYWSVRSALGNITLGC